MTRTEPDTTKLRPAEIFFHFIVTMLTPMFLAAAGGNAVIARQAATETVNAYGARSLADLLPIAQLIALGLAVLNSLSLSMEQDISVGLVLRLRGNAASLNRGVEQCRRALHAALPRGAAPHWREPETDPEEERRREAEVIAEIDRTEASVAAAKASLQVAHTQPAARPAPTGEAARRTAWASAMTHVAREYTDSIAQLPQAARRDATVRATILGSVAQELLSGAQLPPSPFTFKLQE